MFVLFSFSVVVVAVVGPFFRCGPRLCETLIHFPCFATYSPKRKALLSFTQDDGGVVETLLIINGTRH